MQEQTTLYGFEVREPDLRRSRNKSYEIKSLWQLNHEILGLAVRGMETTQIAEVLGIARSTVSSTLNSKLGKEKLSRLRRERDDEHVDAAKEIARLSKQAFEVYESIFKNPDTPYKLKKETADTILLDLAGHRAPTKIDSRHLNVYATKEEIEEFKRRGIEAAREAGMIIDVEPEKNKIELKEEELEGTSDRL